MFSCVILSHVKGDFVPLVLRFVSHGPRESKGAHGSSLLYARARRCVYRDDTRGAYGLVRGAYFSGVNRSLFEAAASSAGDGRGKEGGICSTNSRYRRIDLKFYGRGRVAARRNTRGRILIFFGVPEDGKIILTRSEIDCGSEAESQWRIFRINCELNNQN